MSFSINDEKLLEKYTAIWTKIEDLKIIKLDALPVYDNRYIKTKIRTNGDKVYTNFHDLNVMIYDVKLLQSFLLTLYLYMMRNIICKYF